MNYRRKELIDALPSHDWSIAKAGITIGYSESYAKTRLVQALKDDVEFCRAVEAKREEVAKLAPWNLEELQRQYRKLLRDCEEHGDRTNAKGVLDSLTRIQGGFLDRQQTIDDPAKVRQLEEKEAEEARRIAQIRLRDCG